MSARWEFANPDDECLPITQCVCGATYKLWDLTIGVDADDATTMPCCGRRVYFQQSIEIVEVPAVQA